MYRTTHPPSALAASIRGSLLLFVLAVAFGLSACDQRAAPVAAPSPGEPLRPWHFSTESPAIGTEVGIRALGVGTTTTGKAGWLLFGPYAALPEGSYLAAVQGVTLPGHAGSIYFDVAADKGARVIAALDLDPAALLAERSPDGMIVLPFTLAEAVDDLELRIRVTEQSQLSVSTIDFLPVR